MSFDKFTDKARKVLVLAQEEARMLHQPYVGTEHVLLALLKEADGLAAQALERLGVHYEATVQAIRQVVAIDESADVSGHLSFTPRVKWGKATFLLSIFCWVSFVKTREPLLRCLVA